MPMSAEYRETALKETKESAASLYEDLQHFREVLSVPLPSRGELRRLTNTLRRLLIEEDLIRIAAPRLPDSFRFRINDVMPLVRALQDEPHTFYFNGGAPVLGMTLKRIVEYPLPLQKKIGSYDKERMIDANLNSFLSHQVVCLKGQWIARRSIIKYVAYILGEIHAGTAKTQTDQKAEPILNELRRIATVKRESGYHIDLDIITSGVPPGGTDFPFVYSADTVDIVLLELLATVKFIIDSPDTTAVDNFIRQELGIS